ncbi:MAG: SOS response-associated peptidase, partial [Acidimicrobiales bacterium]
MCGRYTSTASLHDIAEEYQVDDVVSEGLPPRYNVAPSLQVYTVRTRVSEEGESRRQLGDMRWGLVPSWAKDASVGNRMINARAEGIASSAAFARAYRRRRCVVPANSFYEWQPQAGVKSKLPWAIRLSSGSGSSGSMMSLAGVWDVWRAPGASHD